MAQNYGQDDDSVNRNVKEQNEENAKRHILISSSQTYRGMILNIISRFGFKSHSLSDAENMSLHEYVLRSEAYLLEYEDKLNLIHQQAWANLIVKNTEGEGANARPMFKTLKDFYDSDKARDNIRASYEKDYVKMSETPQQKAGDVRVERMIQYEKMRKAKKKNER